MKQDETIFNSGIVYKLQLFWFYLFAFILYPVLLYKIELYLSIIAVFFIIFLFSLRYFKFYETYLEIFFLIGFPKKKIILYKNIAEIKYKYGQYRGLPVIIICTYKNNKIKQIYNLLINRFVLGDTNKVVMLLKYFKNKEINIRLITNNIHSKKKLISQIYSNL
jgi:hypothetical protein